jgi:hypothetical protein
MNLQDCPKFSKCNAPICPLDSDWRLRRMLRDEPVCFYLLEHAKAGSKTRFEGRGLVTLHEAIGRGLPSLTARWGRLRRFYERAKNSGARLEKTIILVREKEYVET